MSEDRYEDQMRDWVEGLTPGEAPAERESRPVPVPRRNRSGPALLRRRALLVSLSYPPRLGRGSEESTSGRQLKGTFSGNTFIVQNGGRKKSTKSTGGKRGLDPVASVCGEWPLMVN